LRHGGVREAGEHDTQTRRQETFASLHPISPNVENSSYRRPSSPFISVTVRPPMRGKGRPLSVIATMISLARGASLICTSFSNCRDR
jgi:hypothetical protein